MNMSIIAASRLRGIKKPNVFIGGVGSIIQTEQDLSAFIINGGVSNFQTDGTDIKFYSKNNSIKDDVFDNGTNPLLSELVTHFIDFTDDLIWGSNVFDSYSRQPDNLIFFYSNNSIDAPRFFADRGGFNRIYVTKSIPFNLSTSLIQQIWFTNNNSPNLETLWYTKDYSSVDAAFQSNVNYYINRGVGTVKYITDETKPNAVTDLSAITIGGTYVELGFTQPSHVNTLKYALIFVDGFFNNIQKIGTNYAVNLEELASYNIKIILADEYFNISDYSNTINVTTTSFNISQNTIGGTYVLLDENYIAPNETKTVDVYVDGVLNNTITNASKSNIYATNLDELTNYDIYLVIESNQSNTINVTTTTTPALFQNAVAYYKLDETSVNAIDVVNGFNGSLVGGVTQGVAGKIGNAYSFNGNGYIDCGAIDYDEIQISCWFKTSDNSGSSTYFFGQGSNAQGQVLRFRIVNGVIDSPVFGGVVKFGSNAFNDGQWHLLSVSLPSKTSNTSQFELRVDNVLQSITSDPNINMNIDTTQLFIIGAANTTTAGFNGQIDEFFINNERLTTGENSDLYNNGNGITY